MMKSLGKYKKVFTNALWLVIYGVIFYAATFWQQKDMLETYEAVPVYDLTLLDIEGKTFEYNFANQQEDTLIYFFAPWCSVCHASIDNLEAVKQAKLDNLNVILIALDWRSIDEVNEFLNEHNLTMPVLLGTRSIQRDFKIKGFPSYYLVTKDGLVRAKGIGYSTEIGMRLALQLNGN